VDLMVLRVSQEQQVLDHKVQLETLDQQVFLVELASLVLLDPLGQLALKAQLP
jgi:hypothetical protein